MPKKYWLPLGSGSAHFGVLLRVHLDEMRCWNTSGSRPKLGDNEPKSFGLEWWPKVVLGLSYMF